MAGGIRVRIGSGAGIGSGAARRTWPSSASRTRIRATAGRSAASTPARVAASSRSAPPSSSTRSAARPLGPHDAGAPTTTARSGARPTCTESWSRTTTTVPARRAARTGSREVGAMTGGAGGGRPTEPVAGVTGTSWHAAARPGGPVRRLSTGAVSAVWPVENRAIPGRLRWSACRPRPAQTPMSTRTLDSTTGCPPALMTPGSRCGGRAVVSGRSRRAWKARPWWCSCRRGCPGPRNVGSSSTCWRACGVPDGGRGPGRPTRT